MLIDRFGDIDSVIRILHPDVIPTDHALAEHPRLVEIVVAEEKLLADMKQRIRFVRQGPDGALYILQGASIVRLTPKK